LKSWVRNKPVIIRGRLKCQEEMVQVLSEEEPETVEVDVWGEEVSQALKKEDREQ
jgi:hypothetical protein